MTAWTVDPVNLTVVRCKAGDPSRCRWHGQTDPQTGEWSTSQHYRTPAEAEARAERMAELRAARLGKAALSKAGPVPGTGKRHVRQVSDGEYHELTASAEDVAETIAAMRADWPATGESFEATSSQQSAMLADVLQHAGRFSGLRRWLGGDCDYMELSKCLLSPPIGLSTPCAWAMRPVRQPDGRYKVDLSGWRRALLTTVVNDESPQVPQAEGGEPPSPEGRMAAAVLFFKGKCAYCGRPLKRVYYNDDSRDPNAASGDHVRPLSPAWSRGKGYDCTFGTTRYGNTVLCCARCNTDKRSYRLKDYMDSATLRESPGDAARRREAMVRLNEFRQLTGAGRIPKEVHVALFGKLRILQAKSREMWAEQESNGGLSREELVEFGRLMDLAAEEARLSMGLPRLESKFVDESAFDRADRIARSAARSRRAPRHRPQRGRVDRGRMDAGADAADSGR